MSVNNPEVQVLYDTGRETMVKIHGYYNSATTSNTKVITANALTFANASQTCLVSITRIMYQTQMTGIAQLQWQGSGGNTPIVSFGRSAAGTFEGYMTNNGSSPTGDINLWVVGAANNDSYDLFLTLNKEQGFANAFLLYDGPGQRIP